MKFLIDAQLPPALARWLGDAGHDAVHVHDVGLLAAGDNVIWMRALESGAIVVTKDEDFATRATRTDNGPVVLWLRIGNTSNRSLRAWFDARLPGIVRLVEQGHRLVEIF